MDVPSKDVEGTISLSPYRPSTYLRVSPPLAPLPKSHYSLFAISNVFGWAVVVISSPQDSVSSPAFLLARLDDLQTAIDQAEPYSTTPFDIQEQPQTLVVPIRPLCPDPSVFITHVSFAAWDRLVVVATSNGSLHIFSLHALITQKSTVPLRSIPSASNVPLNMLVPNPSHGGSLSGVIALVYQDGTIKVVDCYDTEKTYWTSQLVTAAEWSPMGKRLIVGYSDGRLEFITHDGVSKGKIDPPALVEKDGHSVLHIEWVDQKNYLVSFTPTTDQSEALNETYCLHVPKQSASPAYTFARVVDAINSDGDPSLSPKLLTAAISANPKTNWKYIPFFLDLEEGRPEIPVAEDDYSPSAPLGIAISFSLRDKTPLVWCYTADGVLILWKLLLLDPSLSADLDVWNEICDYSDISTLAEEDMQEAPQPLNSEDVSASHYVVPQTLTSLQSSGFANFASSNLTTVFGQPYPTNSQITSGPLSSGQVNLFGQLSPGNSLATTSQASAFGKPSLLKNPSTTAVALGEPSLFGNLTSSVQLSACQKPNAFGSLTKPPSAQVSFFGEPNAFGKLASSTTPPVLKQPSAFGKTGFPSSSGPLFPSTVLGTPPAQVSLFGKPSALGNPASSTTASAFGKPSALGKPAFLGAPESFSSSTAFGKSAIASIVAGATTSTHAASRTQPKPEGSLAFSSTGFAAVANPSGKSQPGGFAQLTTTNSQASFLIGNTATPSASIFENPSILTGNTQTPSACIFGNPSSLTGNTATPSASLFGNPSLLTGNTATPSASLFGNPSSLTGNTATPSASLFGNPSSLTSNTATPSASIFGDPSSLTANTATPSASLFGNPSLLTGNDATPSASLFGNPSSLTGNTATPSASLFGNPSSLTSNTATPSASIFGNPSSLTGNTATPSASLFGNPSSLTTNTAIPTASLFGNPSYLPGNTATPSASIFENPPSAEAVNGRKSQNNSNNLFSQFFTRPAKLVKGVTRTEHSSFLQNPTITNAALSSFEPRVIEDHERSDDVPKPQSAGFGPSSFLSVANEDVDAAQPNQILSSALDKSSVPSARILDAIDALSLQKEEEQQSKVAGKGKERARENNKSNGQESIQLKIDKEFISEGSTKSEERVDQLEQRMEGAKERIGETEARVGELKGHSADNLELNWSLDSDDEDLQEEAKEALKGKMFEMGLETVNAVKKLMKLVPASKKQEGKRIREELKKGFEGKRKEAEVIINNL
ncbi:hypothetical protein PCANC_09714 [Puccinia coronata f. sp. avenae]|uniref:Nucleoporin Nup159/Nup146 N-terminal domain-containing protein n=1 Tax=Puccinia coronata f. sp. avenae TaxID=200324 RepID=A0A2N5V7G6_9BASI|nr:hypothetical protein PCANC_09714 [Puccinia coronata f. sp. avenae]